MITTPTTTLKRQLNDDVNDVETATKMTRYAALREPEFPEADT
jgi:hypothetical protein